MTARGRARLAVSLVGAALCVAVAVVAAPAQATFQGQNGHIAYTSETDGNPEIYVLGGPRLTSNPSDDRSPAWSYTGGDVAFASDRGGDFEIYKVPAAGSANPTALTSNSVADESPSWAPDSSELVIVRDAGGGDTDLVIIATDGSGATTPLTAFAAVSGEVDPNWAPNGLRIAFAGFAPGATQRDIFTIASDGSGLTNLTNSPAVDDREPNWAPQNARITYSSQHNGDYDIHVMNADGTGDVNITNYPSADDRDPAWSPDAARIAFTSERFSFGRDIHNVASNGANTVREIGGAGPQTQPDWQRLPPPECSDELDNDGDGLTDFPSDLGCSSDTDSDETNPACVDGLDNDGNGLTDHPDDPGCSSPHDANEAPACSDTQDNDADGRIDYLDDAGCSSPSDNDESNTQECADGLDNDGDGAVDSSDDGCDNTWDRDELGPGCSDRLDNDGDGAIDYPHDRGCTGNQDQFEFDLVCDDGLDNDGDGKIDYPSDLGCTSDTDSDETNPVCIDGVDNDGDGEADFPDDPGCTSALDGSETNPACIDGLDNDGDGETDLNDPGCRSTADDHELSLCDDGIDNDHDTKIDYPEDPDCASAAEDTERNVACSDSVDNDGDGKIDYPEDQGCTGSADNVEANACTDGLDNDGDTRIDFPDDPGCTSAQDNNEFNPPQCSDGVDNDGDGKTDYPNEPGCSATFDNDEGDDPTSGAFVRPKSASVVAVSLVPAFVACQDESESPNRPNRRHGPPLAARSCAPPAPSATGAATVGTPDSNGAAVRSSGTIELQVQAGGPGPPEDSDVAFTGSITDVRCRAGVATPCGNANAAAGPDYTGALQASATFRITARGSSASPSGGTEGATVVDLPFPLPMSCAATADSAIGATCDANTSLDAILPTVISEGRRSVFQLGQIFVNDGGADGDVSTTPNGRFLTQGVFVP